MLCTWEIYLYIYIYALAFYSLRRHPPRSAVLNLELCLPCTQFSRDLIFSIIIDSISCHILELMLPEMTSSDDSPASRLFLRFFFSFSLAYLYVLTIIFANILTYFTRAGWYYFELFLITCVICNIINFIVTIPKYRGTMDTNYFLLFRLPRGGCNPRFSRRIMLFLLLPNASLLCCA